MNARHRANANRQSDPDNAPPAPRRRPRRLRSIRARLTLIIGIPTLLLIGMAGIGVTAQIGARASADATARYVGLVLAAQELIHSLQRERGLTNGLIGGESRYRADVDSQRIRSDRARTALDSLLTDGEIPGAPQIRASLENLNGLTQLRATADAGRTDKQTAFAFYTAAITAITDAGFQVEVGRDDPALRRGLEALEALSRAKEAAAAERGLLNGVFAGNAFTPEEYTEFHELRAAKLDALARFTRVATARQAGALSDAQQSKAAATSASLELRAIAGARGQSLGVSPRVWWDAMTTYIDDLREVQRSVGQDVREQSLRQRDADTRNLIAILVAAAALLIGAALLAAVTSRSILRPLHRLTTEANEVAERRLPEAVARIQATDDPDDVVTGVESALTGRDDEFAEVARALVNVHRTALHLAVEQAVLRRNTAESLANLGRRNQNLVRRQLGFISALERDETDPNALANLFELDHLATRMRRNAESLLVLVGERSPRRSAEPVAVGDVLRSALAEVEDYRRVVLRRVDEAMVRGAVVAEVAHLLAELIENALVFSPPDQDVEIQARSDGGEYHIAIVDQGVGMTAEDLASANARLRGEQSFLVAPTRYLGHYVVGRLAERLGVRVWLHDSPLAGITARVVLPADLLVREAVPATTMELAAVAAGPARPSPEPPALSAGGAAAEGPAATGAAPAWAPAPRGADSATTPNGLVKRVPRAAHRRQPAEPAYTGGNTARPVPDRSPEQVRSMLNDFRSGVRRGEQKSANREDR